jgi:hypothetical protein
MKPSKARVSKVKMSLQKTFGKYGKAHIRLIAAKATGVLVEPVEYVEKMATQALDAKLSAEA